MSKGEPHRSLKMSKDPLLSVKSCDLLKSKNEPTHHTDDYNTVASRLVVRRGQSFMLRLTFNRDTNFPLDSIRFELRTGGSPRKTHHSLYYLDLIDPKSGDVRKDGVRYSTLNTGKVLDLEVFTPSDMGIGQWHIWMYSKAKGRRSETRSTVSDNIVMLFNAWNKDDDVYMEKEKWRNEFVLNDEGRQYYGSARRIGGMDWYFGQFEKESLDAALKLVSMERLPYRSLGNAVEIARHMSALVNANDDDGVLVGNWSGDYDGGTSPTDWVGSYAILKQYVEKGIPVQYGQCWVFAGVLCSVLRVLGIPARCVTNFESAHDTDANLTIDYHFDENDKSMDNDDSVWNFHVWNDVWMARPDLPKGFGGWQALDATPQEDSSGKMRCGPMPIQAIKQGLIYFDYDGPFIYAEVNGTKRYWRRTQKNPEKFTETYSSTDVIGKNMSTKEVGTNSRQDVTDLYKYTEGSPEELLSFKTARKYVKFTKSERKEMPTVVKFEGDIPDVVPIGKDIVATFKFTNITKSSQDVFLGVVGKVMQYNGSVIAKILDMDIVEKIAPGASKEVKTTLSAGKYLSEVKNNDSIKFFALGGVKGSGRDPIQTFAYNDTVELDKPTISIKASGSKFKLGDSVSLTLSFTNPLSTTLFPGKLRAEGSGISDVLEIPVPTIKAKASYTKTISVKPRRSGNRRVIVGYSSISLSGIRGSVDFIVSAK